MNKSLIKLGQTIKFFRIGDKIRGYFRVGHNVGFFECDTSVAYAYFRVLIDRKCDKTASYFFTRSRDERLIRGSPGWRNNMKKQDSEKKDPAPAPVAPLRSGKSDIESSSHHEGQEDHKHYHLGIRCLKPNCHFKMKRPDCKHYCLVSTYVVLSVLAILISIAVLIVTGLASVATKVYDAEQSSRLVAMIVLAVTAAIGLSMIIYAVIAAVKTKTKVLHVSGVVLVIIAIIQALVIGVAINVTVTEELSIAKYLGDSFILAREDNPRHVKLWSSTQSELQCCGFLSPEDYRDPVMPFYFPPNVPISCCPSYDDKKPAYNQDQQRELCKVNKTFYEVGCKNLVIEVFKETAMVVITIVAVLIVLEVLLAFVGTRLISKQKKDKKAELHEDHELPQHLSNSSSNVN